MPRRPRRRTVAVARADAPLQACRPGLRAARTRQQGGHAMSKSHRRPATPDRRTVVLGGSALLGAAALPPAVAGAAEPGLGSAAELLAAMRRFLAGLEPDKRKAASFAWNGPEWRGWNYFGFPRGIKPGLRLEQMDAAQKTAAWDLLATLLSSQGLAKAKNVMLLQDVLASQGDGAGQRSSERFSLAVFGTPADAGAWGVRLEGHHLHHS